MSSRDQRGAFASLPVRTLTGLIWGTALIGALLLPTPAIAFLSAAIGAFAAFEFYTITLGARRSVIHAVGVIAVVAAPIAAAFHHGAGLMVSLAVFLLAIVILHVWAGTRLSDTALIVLGAAYVGFGLAHLVLVRSLEAGVVLSLALLFGVWANDILAYFAGSLLGRHKLAPRISPNKTWEGFVAGAAGTVAVWLAVPLVADTGISLLWHLVLGSVLAVAAVLGDLFESRVKREAGVKDSGALLPGHGGFLDRIDSLLLVSIVGYYLLLAGGAR